MVIHSPESSALSARVSGGRKPRELAGLSPLPLPMAAWKLGVDGRPIVGDDTLGPVGDDPVLYKEPGRARREGERPGGRGEEERGGRPEPVYFF